MENDQWVGRAVVSRARSRAMSVGGTSRPSGFAVLSLRSLDVLRRHNHSSVEKLQPKEPQTWKTTRRVGKSFANGWRFRRTSDRRQIRPWLSPKGPSSRTSFNAAAASRTTESWDGCCRASAGRDRCSRPRTPAKLRFPAPPTLPLDTQPNAHPCGFCRYATLRNQIPVLPVGVKLKLGEIRPTAAETRPYGVSQPAIDGTAP